MAEQIVHWLWNNWIPRGMCTALYSGIGTGKSFVAQDVCRRVLRDEPFPDGAPAIEEPEAKVLYIDSSISRDLFLRRFRAWDVDGSRLYLRPRDIQTWMNFDNDEYRDQVADLVFWERPAIIVLDTFDMSYGGSSKPHRKTITTRLSFWNDLASTYQCAVLLTEYPRKVGKRPRLTALADLVPVVLHLQYAPQAEDLNGPRRLQVIKSQIAPIPSPLDFEIVSIGDDCGAELRYGPSLASDKAD